MSLRSRAWRVRYGRWGTRRSQRPGYTLLLPVPGDLPVFLDLALAVCRRQESSHRVSTLVVPDQMTPRIASIVDQASETWPGPLRCLPLGGTDERILRRLGDPGRNHAAQIIAGVKRADSTHVLLHDADLFAQAADLHEREYLRARDGQLDVLGVSPAWDPWFASRGRTLAATWEMCVRTDWMRAFPPHRHMGHDATVDSERHTFDTTFWPQWHTSPDRIAVAEDLVADVVHFNYVISSYRAYRRDPEGFRDKAFRLLLIRIFVELFGDPQDDYGLPTIAQLARRIADGADGDERPSPQGYRTMRVKLDAVVHGPWSTQDRAERCLELLGELDDLYWARPGA